MRIIIIDQLIKLVNVITYILSEVKRKSTNMEDDLISAVFCKIDSVVETFLIVTFDKLVHLNNMKLILLMH